MKLLRTTAAVAALAIGAGLAVQADDVSEETRDVPEFTEVYLQGSMDVDVIVGKERSVRVEADSDIIDHIQTEVRGNALRIGLERGHYRNIKKMKVYVTLPNMTAAGVQGSGDMIVEGAKADEFDLELQGSGDATFKDAKFGKLDIELQGSGDIELAGTCTDVEIELQGSGDVDADDLICKSATVDLQGSGDVAVHATESADIEVRGSGDVVVSGSPDKLRSKVRGSGDIEVR